MSGKLLGRRRLLEMAALGGAGALAAACATAPAPAPSPTAAPPAAPTKPASAATTPAEPTKPAAAPAATAPAATTPAPPTAAPAATAPAAATPAAAAPAATAPGAPAKGPGLVLWTDPTNIAFFSEVGKGFSDKYGVPLAAQNVNFSEIQSKTLLAAPAGEGPDLLEANHDWLGAFLKAAILAPIELGPKRDSLERGAVGAYTAQGKLYGLPVSVESMFVARNKELVPAAVRTWDDFDAIAKDLLARGINYPLLLEPNAYLYISIQTAFGGYAFGRNSDGSYNPEDCGVDSPGSVAAARWLDSAAKKGYVKPDTPFDTAKTLMAQAKAGLYPVGPWVLSTLRQAGVKYAIDPPPTGAQDAKPFMGVRGLLANKFGKQVPLAQTFLTEFWANDGPYEKFQELTSRQSPWTPARAKARDPDLIAQIEAGKNAEPMPAFPQMSAYWPAVGDALKLVMSQKSDPEPAFKTAADKIRKAIQEQK